MCENTVSEFKKNCHVVPRSFVKRTKGPDGRNILLDLNNNEISINQADYKDDYWCENCEKESAKDDSYGAEILIHKTIGKISDLQMPKADFKKISNVDYQKFKKFILSIAIRDHLARILNSQPTLMSQAIFIKLRDAYFAKTEDILIVGYYLKDGDPMASAVHPPTSSRNKDGVNFQLFNFNFLIYFSSSDQSLQRISLQHSGELLLIIRTREQTGTYKDLDKSYSKIVNDSKNEQQLNRIKEKYK